MVDFCVIFQHAKAEKRNKVKTRESGKTRTLILQHMVGRIRQKAQARSLPVHGPPPQKSVARPFCSQSPKRVGSGPLGPPISLGLVGGALAGGGAGAGVSAAGFSVMTK
jgi:hypothetical protein